MTFYGCSIARLLLALAVVGLGFVIYAVLAEGPTGIDDDVVNVEVDYAIEPTDERQLVGSATNVFVGRVIGKVGPKERLSPGPERRFAPDPVLRCGAGEHQ